MRFSAVQPPSDSPTVRDVCTAVLARPDKTPLWIMRRWLMVSQTAERPRETNLLTRQTMLQLSWFSNRAHVAIVVVSSRLVSLSTASTALHCTLILIVPLPPLTSATASCVPCGRRRRSDHLSKSLRLPLVPSFLHITLLLLPYQPASKFRTGIRINFAVRIIHLFSLN